MPKYIVNLHCAIAYDYEVEANSVEEAIEKSKDILASQQLEEMNKHMYDFDWLECDAEEVKENAK